MRVDKRFQILAHHLDKEFKARELYGSRVAELLGLNRGTVCRITAGSNLTLSTMLLVQDKFNIQIFNPEIFKVQEEYSTAEQKRDRFTYTFLENKIDQLKNMIKDLNSDHSGLSKHTRVGIVNSLIDNMSELSSELMKVHNRLQTANNQP
jgi:hypothetical protein